MAVTRAAGKQRLAFGLDFDAGDFVANADLGIGSQESGLAAGDLQLDVLEHFFGGSRRHDAADNLQGGRQRRTVAMQFHGRKIILTLGDRVVPSSRLVAPDLGVRMQYTAWPNRRQRPCREASQPVRRVKKSPTRTTSSYLFSRIEL